MSNKHATQTFDEQGVTQFEVKWSNCVLACCTYGSALMFEARGNVCEALEKGKKFVSKEYIYFYTINTTAKA